MKSQLKNNEVKVRLNYEYFKALEQHAADLGMSQSGLLGMLFIEWVKRCVKHNQRAYGKEVPIAGAKRAHSRVGRRINFGGSGIDLQL